MLCSFVTVGQVVRDQQQHGQLAAACNLLGAAGAGPVVPAVAARPHGQPARSIASIIACIRPLSVSRNNWACRVGTSDAGGVVMSSSMNPAILLLTIARLAGGQ